MNLKNGYIEMYNAPAKATAQKKSPVCATKTAPASTDTVLIAYNNSSATALDLKTFKLIYSDGTHLLGSTSGIPAADINDDTNIIIKSGNDIVFGEVIASKLASIKVDPLPSVLSYNVLGSEEERTIKTTGMTVTATYEDNTTKIVTSQVTWTPTIVPEGAEETDAYPITVSYTEGSTTKTDIYNVRLVNE